MKKLIAYPFPMRNGSGSIEILYEVMSELLYRCRSSAMPMANALYRLLKRVAEIDVLCNTGGSQLNGRRIMDALKQYREHHRFCAAIGRLAYD